MNQFHLGGGVGGVPSINRQDDNRKWTAAQSEAKIYLNWTMNHTQLGTLLQLLSGCWFLLCAPLFLDTNKLCRAQP